MSFLESDDGPFERRSRFNQPDNVSRLTTVSSYVPKKQKMTMPNRASFLQERGSVRSGVSSADSISETGYDGDDKALDGKSAKGSKAFRTLPQYYRGNHGEVCLGFGHDLFCHVFYRVWKVNKLLPFFAFFYLFA